MNDLKKQFLGFYHTQALFENFQGLNQFKFEQIDLKNIKIEDISFFKQLPLGKVEVFFEHYIKLALRYNIINKNIQIIKDKNTLGELDFILYDTINKNYEHVELVFKYYLYDPSYENEFDRYIGANRNDTLLRKINKLKNKQFPLIFHKSTKSYINKQIDLENIKQSVCFKANLYLPLDFDSKNTQFFHNCQIRGFYMNREQFISQKAFKSFLYKVPHRYDWLCDEKDNKQWFSYEDTLEEIDFFLSLKKSPLVWMKDKETIKSFFVTWW